MLRMKLSTDRTGFRKHKNQMSEYHREQQESELEVLQSIYPQEFSQDEAEDGKTGYRIHLQPSNASELENSEEIQRLYSLELCFSFPDSYPDQVPEFRLELTHLEDNEDEAEIEELEKVSKNLDQLKAELDTLASESLGMAMIFTLASHSQEWLDKEAETYRERLKIMEEERIQKQEEADRKRFHGTPVTPESFKAWKDKFDKEMKELNKEKIAALALKLKKPSGRQLFESDKTLISSDANYLDEGDVDVDLSLFQEELDGLDLEDSGDEDDVAALIRASGE